MITKQAIDVVVRAFVGNGMPSATTEPIAGRAAARELLLDAARLTN